MKLTSKIESPPYIGRFPNELIDSGIIPETIFWCRSSLTNMIQVNFPSSWYFTHRPGIFGMATGKQKLSAMQMLIFLYEARVGLHGQHQYLRLALASWKQKGQGCW